MADDNVQQINTIFLYHDSGGQSNTKYIFKYYQQDSFIGYTMSIYIYMCI